MYGDISFSSNVLQTISYKKIRLGVFDKHGDLLGYYVPRGLQNDSATVLNQCKKYLDETERIEMACKFEIANLHNMRSNLRYYNKKLKGELQTVIEKFDTAIEDMKAKTSVEDMLLIEARLKFLYYHAFNMILKDEDYVFTRRSRRPPEDEINALISFGNVLLYNQLQQIIWKTSLDSRFGVIHAANRRETSLNLDFADVFKPVIVDRVIFSLINRRQIRKEEHFERNENNAVYLNKAGKKIFIEMFEEKLHSKIVIKGKQKTYLQLMEQHIYEYQQYVRDEKMYKPYKYY